MNLAQLYYFQHLAEIQHYTRAAEDLCISQSALSHSISALEKELGCPLFSREGRTVALTEDGRLFKRSVDNGLMDIEGGIAEVKRRHGRFSGTVSVGAIATVRSDYLPAAMKAYREEYGPFVDFRIAQGETETLKKLLDEGGCDLVIAGPVERPRVACETLFYQRLVVAVGRGHALAALDKVSYDDLAGCDIVTYRSGIACGDTLDAFLRRTGAPLDEMNLIRNYEDEIILGALVVREPVVALTMLTSNLLPNPDMAVLPLAVEGAREFYPVSLTYREKTFRDPAAQAFINFARTFEAPPYVRDDFPF